MYLMGKFNFIFWGASFILFFQACSNKLPESSTFLSSEAGGGGGGGGGQEIFLVLPFPPNQLSLVAASSNQVNVTWIDNSDNEYGFRVERAFSNAGPMNPGTGPGAFTVIAVLGEDIESYTDRAVNPSTYYYYRITAYNNVGASAPTSSVNVNTPAAPSTAPAAPSNLTATAAAATIVNLTWVDNSNNERSFTVERSADNGVTFFTISSVAADQTSYQDINLTDQTTYMYRIRAVNTAGSSAAVTSASVTTLAAGNKNSYAYIQTNIITPNCTQCHGANKADAGIRLHTYNGVLSVLIPNNANGSRIIQETSTGQMPPGAPLSTDQINSIRNWINAGALNN